VAPGDNPLRANFSSRNAWCLQICSVDWDIIKLYKSLSNLFGEEPINLISIYY